jgi:hypothetical protein
MIEEGQNDWQELLDFIEGKKIVGIAVSDDEADFDLIFEDGSRLELYAVIDEDEDGIPESYIAWELVGAGENGNEDFSDNGSRDG